MQSRFLQRMGTELRAPLSTILDLSKTIRGGAFGELSPDVSKVLGRMEANGAHLSTLFDHMLEESANGDDEATFPAREFSLSEVVRGVVVTVGTDCDKRLALALDVPPDLPVARGDRDLMHAALLSLVGNAIKFTEHGEVGIAVTADDDVFHIQVSDTGSGIAAAHREEIFSAFRQIDGSKGGAGIGLALARRWVQVHGGHIWLESEVGRGSTFHVTIPIHPASQVMQTTADELRLTSGRETRFLWNVAQELRTPLNAIIGYTELIQDGYYGGQPSESISDALSRVQGHGQRLLALILNLLDLCRIEAGEFRLASETFFFSDLVESVVQSAKPSASGKQLALAVDVPTDLPIALGDRFRLSQVLQFLVDNAIKFTEQGELGITVAADDDVFHIRVSDTGPGIAEAHYEDIFSAFRQIDDSKSGVGIGLALAKRFVQMHGGHIWLDSEIGRGSSFHVTIPVRFEAGWCTYSSAGGQTQTRLTKVLVEAIPSVRRAAWLAPPSFGRARTVYSIATARVRWGSRSYLSSSSCPSRARCKLSLDSPRNRSTHS